MTLTNWAADMLDRANHKSAIDVVSGLRPLFDGISQALIDFDGASLTAHLKEINEFRLMMRDEADIVSAQELIQGHQVFPLLLEDPYTHHSFSKPRGFAGDASLIDLFYGHRSGSEAKTEIGRFVFETLMRSASCDAVRFRRGYYGAFIDQIYSQMGEQARVLALACGHLREALFSRAVSENKVQLIGIDSDPLAVREAERALIGTKTLVRHNSVVDFIRRKAWGEKHDFIYAAGLFDYLDDRVARKVVSTSFDALNPGGILSFANFLPTIVEKGYMDLVMDWRLIYRSPDDMAELTSHLPADTLAQTKVWTDPLNTVVYLTVTKRG